MANWQRTLNLQPEWNMYEDNISLQDLAQVISNRLAELESFSEEDIEQHRKDLVDEFELLAHDPDADVEQFDGLMKELYDWADQPIGSSNNFFNTKKVCWISTLI